MTVFSYDKVQKRYLWTSFIPQAVVGDGWQRAYWPILFLLCAIIVTSLFSHVFFSIAQTDIVFDIKKAEREVKTINGENGELRVRLALTTSPSRLADVARDRGLVKVQNPTYISSITTKTQ
ncbi:MAG: hypothetical protein AAB611_00205 [Patescibacteria group bacterium]